MNVWWSAFCVPQHNECVVINFYANDFGILLRSCAQKLWKSVNICKSYSKKTSGTFFSWTRCIIIRAASCLCFVLVKPKEPHRAPPAICRSMRETRVSCRRRDQRYRCTFVRLLPEHWLFIISDKSFIVGREIIQCATCLICRQRLE